MRPEQALPQTPTWATTPHGAIAVVDDDSDVLEALGMWLELRNLGASCHSSGESLLQAVHTVQGHLTLDADATHPLAVPLQGAILDINLPGITGIELARSLRQLDPSLPLVIITALREDERLRYGLAPEGVRYLQKPFDLAVLEDALLTLPH